MALFAALDHAFVDLGNPDKLNFDGRITLMAWVRVGRTDGFHNIIAHGITTSRTEVWLRVYNGQYHGGSWDIVNGDHKTACPIPPQDVGAWVHLCGMYDGASWKLYRNGELAAQTSDTQGSFTVAEPWAIGGRVSGADPRFFDGMIAYASVWNVAVDEATIAACIEYPAKLTGTEPGLVSYWPLDEGSGDLIHDRAAHPANGVLRSWRRETPLPGWALEAGAGGASSSYGNPMMAMNGRLHVVRGVNPRNAVLSSADGRTWRVEVDTPPWPTGSWRNSVLHGNALYLLPGFSRPDMWASAPGDPRSWSRASDIVPWAVTEYAAASFQNRIWILGGVRHDGRATNDVWTWSPASGWLQQPAPPWPVCTDGAACVCNGRLWFAFRNPGSGVQDVWSTDGTSWRNEPQSRGVSRRTFAPLVAMGDTMFIIGGQSDHAGYLNDLYSSTDGRTWTPLSTSGPWRTRTQHAVGVLDNRIYLGGGYADAIPPVALDDVWSFGLMPSPHAAEPTTLEVVAIP